MSEMARKLFDSLRQAKEAMSPLVKDALAQTGAEFSRLGTQGSMELASALFNGSAFVPYGPGQYTPTPEHANSQSAIPNHEQSHQHERGLER